MGAWCSSVYLAARRKKIARMALIGLCIQWIAMAAASKLFILEQLLTAEEMRMLVFTG